MFGRKKSPSLEELRSSAIPSPDSDGVTRVFSKRLWDDPKVGNFLREMGMNPDDKRNLVKTADEYMAWFAKAREALAENTAGFNRENSARYGHCNARPMLIIAPEIWDGEHGAFLYGQLDLCGFDNWNVLMCAADQQTIDQVGLIGHPGSVPALTQKMVEKIVSLKDRYRVAHDALGRSVLSQPGIDGAEFDQIVATIKTELLDYVEFCRAKIFELFSRPAT